MSRRNGQTIAIAFMLVCLALVPLGASAEEVPTKADTLWLHATVAPWAAVDLGPNITLTDDGDSHSSGSTTLSVWANFWYDLNADWYTPVRLDDGEFTFINLTHTGAEPGEQTGVLHLKLPRPSGSTSGTPVTPSGWYGTTDVYISVPDDDPVKVGGIVVTLSTAADGG